MCWAYSAGNGQGGGPPGRLPAYVRSGRAQDGYAGSWPIVQSTLDELRMMYCVARGEIMCTRCRTVSPANTPGILLGCGSRTAAEADKQTAAGSRAQRPWHRRTAKQRPHCSFHKSGSLTSAFLCVIVSTSTDQDPRRYIQSFAAIRTTTGACLHKPLCAEERVRIQYVLRKRDTELAVLAALHWSPGLWSLAGVGAAMLDFAISEL